MQRVPYEVRDQVSDGLDTEEVYEQLELYVRLECDGQSRQAQTNLEVNERGKDYADVSANIDDGAQLMVLAQRDGTRGLRGNGARPDGGVVRIAVQLELRVGGGEG